MYGRLKRMLGATRQASCYLVVGAAPVDGLAAGVVALPQPMLALTMKAAMRASAINFFTRTILSSWNPKRLPEIT